MLMYLTPFGLLSQIRSIGNTNAVTAILVKGHHVRASSSTLYGDGSRMKIYQCVWFLLSGAI